MIITCDACSARFRLDDHLIKPTGTKLRCAKCRRVFTAYPEVSHEPEAPAMDDETASTSPSHVSTEPDAEPHSPETEGGALPQGGEDHSEFEELDFELSAQAESDAGDLDLDFLDFAIEPEPRAVLEAEGFEVDLDQLDMSLDPGTGKGPELKEIPDTEGLRPDLSTPDGFENLDLSRDDVALPHEESPSDLREVALTADAASPAQADIELDLSMDETATAETAALDFDFESAPGKTEPAPETEAMDFVVDEPAEPAAMEEIEFELDEDSPMEAEAPTRFEDFDFELEEDPVDASRSPAETPASFEEFDFELEEDPVEAPSTTADHPTTIEEFDFDLDEDPLESPEVPDETVGALDFEVEAAPSGSDSEAGLDFDFSQETPELETKPDLDTFELELEEAAPAEESGEFEMALDLDRETEERLALELESAPEEMPEPEPETADLTETASPAAEKRLGEDTRGQEAVSRVPDRLATSPSLPRMKKSNPLGLVLFVLVLMASMGGGFYYLQSHQITLPLLGTIGTASAPEIQDPGNLNIAIPNYTHKFITNATAGRLLVISGNVLNDYKGDRSRIYLLGTLLATGNRTVATRRVYAGNTLTNAQLESMEPTEIDTQLNKPAGDNSRNLNVRPGQSIPFMLVFSELPSDLSEFTVEVVRSAGRVKK